jgi:hypothetical protein
MLNIVADFQATDSHPDLEHLWGAQNFSDDHFDHAEAHNCVHPH